MLRAVLLKGRKIHMNKEEPSPFSFFQRYQGMLGASIKYFVHQSVSGDSSPVLAQEERHMKRLLWYLLGGTRGGPNRAEIIRALRDRPCNANQLAEMLSVDYKTVQHHIRVLGENGLVTLSEKGTYGAVLFLTPKMEQALPVMEDIWNRIGRTKISKTEEE